LERPLSKCDADDRKGGLVHFRLFGYPGQNARPAATDKPSRHQSLLRFLRRPVSSEPIGGERIHTAFDGSFDDST
jgi:hypothetical protein